MTDLGLPDIYKFKRPIWVKQRVYDGIIHVFECLMSEKIKYITMCFFVSLFLRNFAR